MKNKSKGLLILLAPVILLILVLVLFALTQFIVGQLSVTSDASAYISLIRSILSVFGILSVFSFFICVPVGLVYMTKADTNEISPDLRQKYPQLTDDDIRYVNSGSIAAFFGAPIWALGNKLWLWALLGIIPGIGFIVSIYLAIKGRALAWEKLSYTSVQDFKERQKRVAIIVMIAVILLTAFQIYLELAVV